MRFLKCSLGVEVIFNTSALFSFKGSPEDHRREISAETPATNLNTIVQPVGKHVTRNFSLCSEAQSGGGGKNKWNFGNLWVTRCLMRTYIIDSETESSDQNQGIRLGLEIWRVF